MTKTGEVYLLLFRNGKGYVGLTRVGVARRFIQHRCDARRGKGHCYLVGRAWRKYGEPALFNLGRYPLEQVAQIEINTIAAFNTQTPGGYNKSPGGTMVGERPVRMTPCNVARMEGKKQYTGKSCALGHTLRHVANNSCVICERDQLRSRRRVSARRIRAGV